MDMEEEYKLMKQALEEIAAFSDPEEMNLEHFGLFDDSEAITMAYENALFTARYVVAQVKEMTEKRTNQNPNN